MTAGPAATVLAVDLGTGGPKTAIVGLDGRVVGAAHRRAEPVVGADGSATQNPETWWEAVVDAVRELVDAHPEAAKRLCAVAVTGQWGSTVPVDRNGDPVGDCMLWMDTRGGALARERLGGRIEIEGFAPRAVLKWIQRTGGAPSTEGNDPLGHRLWIEHHEPEVYRSTATFLEPIDFICARFTGRVLATPVSMLLSWLCDNRRLDQDRYDPELAKLAGADLARLPLLVKAGTVLGTVQASLAQQLGLPSDLPVVNSMPDLHTAAIGAGSTGMYEPHVSISTSAWVGCYTPDKRTSLARQMATVPSGLPGKYVLANNHETAGVCLEWARSAFVLAEDGLTSPALTSFRDLDAVAAGAAPGSGGVIFAPFLNGERSPVADSTLRGSFLNLSLSTTRAQMIRAVLEGVAYNARWLFEASEKVVRHQFGPARAIGGGSESDLWCQIHADVLGRPLGRVESPLYVNVKGAALYAGIVLGKITEAEAAKTVVVDRTFTPDPDAAREHQRLYSEFVQLPKLQKKMYRRLNGR
jgi:xylulokinase